MQKLSKLIAVLSALLMCARSQPPCTGGGEHNWGHWEVGKREGRDLQNDLGNALMVRYCTKCGRREEKFAR